MNQPSGELEPTDPTGSTSIKIRRCAVYARVSSSSREDTPLSSIEAQIESCKAYVHSQKGMGWELIEPVYADDGYSGGSMNRPAIRQLFQDMEDGKIDAVVIPRLDRICRNVLDICDIIPLFTIPSIALVSVNQSLDTKKKERNSLSEDKNQGNLTHRVRKEKRGSPQIQGLPGMKKGDRENLSPVYGGGIPQPSHLV